MSNADSETEDKTSDGKKDEKGTPKAGGKGAKPASAKKSPAASKAADGKKVCEQKCSTCSVTTIFHLFVFVSSSFHSQPYHLCILLVLFP